MINRTHQPVQKGMIQWSLYVTALSSEVLELLNVNLGMDNNHYDNHECIAYVVQ